MYFLLMLREGCGSAVALLNLAGLGGNSPSRPSIAFLDYVVLTVAGRAREWNTNHAITFKAFAQTCTRWHPHQQWGSPGLKWRTWEVKGTQEIIWFRKPKLREVKHSFFMADPGLGFLISWLPAPGLSPFHEGSLMPISYRTDSPRTLAAFSWCQVLGVLEPLGSSISRVPVAT